MYKTISLRPITFLGEGNKSITAQSADYEHIHKLNDLFALLLASGWSQETVAPGMRANYDHDNDPTAGQCTITSLLAQDIFGGELVCIKFKTGGTHYLNRINGEIVDLTRDQFTINGIDLSNAPIEPASREHCLQNADVANRYHILAKNLALATL